MYRQSLHLRTERYTSTWYTAASTSSDHCSACCLLLPVGACSLREHPQTYCALRCTGLYMCFLTHGKHCYRSRNEPPCIYVPCTCSNAPLVRLYMLHLTRTRSVNRTERASTPNVVPIMKYSEAVRVVALLSGFEPRASRI